MEWSFLTGVCGNGQLPAYFYKGYLFYRFYKSDNFVRSSGCGRRYYLFSSGSPAPEYENMGTDNFPFFIPYLLPAIGVYKGWQWLYEGNFGLFNFVLRMLGMKPQRFLDSPSQVVPSLVVIAIWTSGNLIVVFLAGLQNVPRVYMEAAEIDGANAWQRFWNVTIPSISPIIFYNVLTALITHLQVINPALALTDGGPGKKSMFMSYVIYLYAFKKNKLGYAAAYSVIFFILVGIFTAVLFKTQKEQIFGEGE